MATYLKHFLLFLAAVATTHGAESDPVKYTPDCVPPTGLTIPGTNASTTTEYPQMAPIERCCPACSDCVEIGGHCKLKWVIELIPEWCDFQTINECRDYGCRCCIKCGDDSCSPCVQTGGNCREKCRADELEDKENTCTFYNNGTGCKCCKKCETTSECTDVDGQCVTNPNDCPLGTYASTGCCGGCYCCKPVMTPSPGECTTEGAYCSETEECANGFWSEFGGCFKLLTVQGLEKTELGYCCVPKVSANSGRRDIMGGAPHNPERLPYGGRRHPKYLED